MQTLPRHYISQSYLKI